MAKILKKRNWAFVVYPESAPSVFTSFFLVTSDVFVSFVFEELEHPVNMPPDNTILRANAPAIKICFVFIYNISFPDLFFIKANCLNFLSFPFTPIFYHVKKESHSRLTQSFFYLCYNFIGTSQGSCLHVGGYPEETSKWL